MTATYDRLRDEVFGLEILDTHEHLPAREADRSRQVDVLGEYLGHYFSCDLVSAGLSGEGLAEARRMDRPIEQRWKVLEPYWEAARNTGYGRSLDIAARDLYGLERIDRRSIARLNEAFLAARQAGGTYDRVLKEKSRIRLGILGGNLDCDRRFFRSAAHLDEVLTVSTVEGLADIARRAGKKAIHRLEDLVAALEALLEGALRAGAVCIKTSLAYRRTLRFEKVTAETAEREFNELFSAANVHPSWLPPRGDTRQLQDYLMHQFCRLADERGLVMQVHTGIQEGNGNYIAHADPVLLSNLFLEYRRVRFDVFHIGYPYQQALAVLAKNFPNVFIDFCWAHIISPTASVRALAEYLDSVPANKISGFGGDYNFVDGVYGHQYIARENVARVLAERVDAGVCGLEEARRLARMILHDNPAALFGLWEKQRRRPADKPARKDRRPRT